MSHLQLMFFGGECEPTTVTVGAAGLYLVTCGAATIV